MPGPKRVRRERTDEWASIQQRTLWPEQELYEQIRPLLLFGETAGERAKETGAAARTLSRKADEFERYGMQSLFSSGEAGGERATSKMLPPEIRQLIVDLHAELPTMSAARNCRDLLHSVWQKTRPSQCQTPGDL
jgi:hypothetical protein